MADRTPTRVNRLQAGDYTGGSQNQTTEAFGEAVLSQQVTLTAANTAANPATFQIAGQFQVQNIRFTNTSALTTTSALAVRVGLAADVTAFHEFSLAAASNNQLINAAVVSARVPNWISTGSAAAVTTVQVVHSAASVRADLSAQVTLNYIVRG